MDDSEHANYDRSRLIKDFVPKGNPDNKTRLPKVMQTKLSVNHLNTIMTLKAFQLFSILIYIVLENTRRHTFIYIFKDSKVKSYV